MRRPLCYVSMAFVVTVFLYLTLCPAPERGASYATDGSRVILQGQVYHKEYKAQQLILYLNYIQVPHVGEDNQHNNTQIQTGIMCYVKEGQEPKLYSDIQITGEIQDFQKATNPGEFDQRRYYEIQKLEFRMVNAHILMESAEYSVYHEMLYQIRRRLERIFDETLPEKEASVMKAMLLGSRQELNKESKQLFQQSGISHILAISGLHISILGMGFYHLLKRIKVPTTIAVVFSVAVMIIYGDMVGMSSSSYRAIFMFAMKMGAKVVRRTYDILTALAISALFLLIEQPLYLFHVGFLLSFGAILGVGYVLEAVKTDTNMSVANKQNKKKQVIEEIKRKAGEGLQGTLAIFLIHCPILLCYYYEFPIYSFLLNLIIIPAIGILLFLGLTCMAGKILPLFFLGEGIAHLAANGCYTMLNFFEGLCRFSLKLPGASWIVGKPDSWRVVFFYGMVILLVVVHQYNKRKGGRGFPFQIKLILILVTTALLTQKTYGKLRITILDVGQGDGIWIETDCGHHYVIDAGSTSKSKVGEYTLLPFLKYTGTDCIDAVFLTHLDRDHTSGIIELLENPAGICIKQIILSQAVIQDEAYDEMQRICKEHKIECKFLQAGDVLTDADLLLEVLHPTGEYITQSRNAYSLVLKLEYGAFHALLTGDVEADGEMLAAQRLENDWKCHLYKAAHHGSGTSNTQVLLEQIKPDLTTISCAEDNRYGHPHQEVIQRLGEIGSQILVTKDTGAIMILVERDKIQVKTFCEK